MDFYDMQNRSSGGKYATKQACFAIYRHNALGAGVGFEPLKRPSGYEPDKLPTALPCNMKSQ